MTTTQEPERIGLKHPASHMLYMRACNTSLVPDGRDADKLAEAITILEESEGAIPPFVDPDAEAFLRNLAEEILQPGKFRTVLKAATHRWDSLPKGVLLLGALVYIDGSSSAVASRQLRSMADKCMGTDKAANREVFEARLRRAIRKEREGGD